MGDNDVFDARHQCDLIVGADPGRRGKPLEREIVLRQDQQIHLLLDGFIQDLGKLAVSLIAAVGPLIKGCLEILFAQFRVCLNIGEIALQIDICQPDWGLVCKGQSSALAICCSAVCSEV